MKEVMEEIDPRDSKYLTQDTVDKIRKLLELIVSDNIAKSPIRPKGMISTDVEMFANKLIPEKGIIYWFKKFLFVRKEKVRLILKIGDSFAFEDLDALIFTECSYFEVLLSILKDRAKRMVYKALH